jgi:Protein of unknown function (DUF3575)
MCHSIRPLRRSYIIWIVLLLVVPTCLLSAQTVKNVLKINPLSIFVGTANVKLEHRLGDRFSGQIGVYVGGPRLQFNSDSTTRYVKYFFVGIIPELRYHISFNHVPNPKGFFVGSYCKYAFVRQQYTAHARTPAGLVRGGVQERNHVATVGFLLRAAIQLFEEQSHIQLLQLLWPGASD